MSESEAKIPPLTEDQRQEFDQALTDCVNSRNDPEIWLALAHYYTNAMTAEDAAWFRELALKKYWELTWQYEPGGKLLTAVGAAMKKYIMRT
jgi:hypothetical protein